MSEQIEQVRPGRAFEAVCDNVPTGAVGTLTFELVRVSDDAVMIPETTGGIVELDPPGVYKFTGLAPVVQGTYLRIWRFAGENTTEKMLVAYSQGTVGTGGHIDSQRVADWLQDQGIGEAFVTNGHIPPAPDRLVIVTFTGGPGELRERTFDALSFQVRTRGRQRIDGDGEALAWEVDDVLMRAHPPVSIGGVRVIRIVRAGSPPSFMLRDDGGRTHAAASYILEAARSEF